MERILSLVIGYGFGLIEAAYIISKAKGVDIQKVGSGNPGATNMLRSMGNKIGFITLAVDLLKCVAAVLLVRAIFSPAEMGSLYGLYAAVGVVIGHMFPFYLRFRGGKGVSSMVGMIIAFGDWRLIVFGLICFFVPYLLTRYISLGSLCLAAGYFAASTALAFTGNLSVPVEYAWEVALTTGIVAALVIIKHRTNLVRLFTKTERKTHIIHRNKE